MAAKTIPQYRADLKRHIITLDNDAWSMGREKLTALENKISSLAFHIGAQTSRTEGQIIGSTRVEIRREKKKAAKAPTRKRNPVKKNWTAVDNQNKSRTAKIRAYDFGDAMDKGAYKLQTTNISVYLKSQKKNRKTYHGDYYFKDYSHARDYALENGFPIDRINAFGRG